MAGPPFARVGRSTGPVTCFCRESAGASSPATQNHRLYVKRVSVNRRKISTRRTRSRHGGSRRKRPGFAGGEAEEPGGEARRAVLDKEAPNAASPLVMLGLVPSIHVLGRL